MQTRTIASSSDSFLGGGAGQDAASCGGPPGRGERHDVMQIGFGRGEVGHHAALVQHEHAVRQRPQLRRGPS